MGKQYIICSESDDLLIFNIVESDSRDDAILKGGTGKKIVLAREYSLLQDSFAKRNLSNSTYTKTIFSKTVVLITITMNGIVKLYTKDSMWSNFKVSSEKDLLIHMVFQEIFNHEVKQDDPIRRAYIGSQISNLEFHPYWYDDDEGMIFADNSIESWDSDIL